MFFGKSKKCINDFANFELSKFADLVIANKLTLNASKTK